MTYNNIEYWRDRQEPNAKNIEVHEPVHLGFLKKHLTNVNSVLDCGPGIGRLFSAYKDVSKIDVYDISDTYKDRLLVKADSLELNIKFTLGNEVAYLPYPDDSFDAAVTTEVLLHLVPDDVLVRMSELVRVANKVIAIAWSEDIPNKKSGIHCFNHNYVEICELYNYEILDLKRYGKQVMFVYRRLKS